MKTIWNSNLKFLSVNSDENLLGLVTPILQNWKNNDNINGISFLPVFQRCVSIFLFINVIDGDTEILVRIFGFEDLIFHGEHHPFQQWNSHNLLQTKWMCWSIRLVFQCYSSRAKFDGKIHTGSFRSRSIQKMNIHCHTVIRNFYSEVTCNHYWKHCEFVRTSYTCQFIINIPLRDDLLKLTHI